MGNTFLPNNANGIPALIVIPTRLNASFLNDLCGMVPQTNGAVPLAQTTPASSPVQPEGGLLEQVAKTNPPSKSSGRSGPPTDGQMKFLKSIAKKQRLSEADICKEIGVQSFDELTNQQVSDFLEEHNKSPW